jgi:poly-gamma-glutamate synthesis protein (capsule biosynthesis protein)
MAISKRSSFPYIIPARIGLISFGLAIAFPILAPSSPIVQTPQTEPEITEPTTDTPTLETPIAPTSTKLLFVGDIMLARDVERTIKNRGTSWPFMQLTPELPSLASVIVGNLETTVRETEQIEEENVLNFDTIPENIKILKDAGFTHLSLANNHTDDFGQEVTIETRSAVEEYGIIPFGDATESGKYIERFTLGDQNISLIGFHAFNEYVIDIEDAIKAEQEAGRFIIIYPHWGTEYVNTPSIYQQEAAKRFIKAGADLIIGAHPHVIQQYEEIDGVPVIYSLGNFLFDQDFSEETKTGLVAVLEITTREIKIEFLPIRIVYRQVLFDDSWNDEAQAALNIDNLVLTIPRPVVQTP